MFFVILTFLLRRTWKTKIIAPCKELQIAKRYLNAIESRLKTSRPKIHVSPSNGSSIAEPLRPTLALFNKASAVVVAVVAVLQSSALNILVELTPLNDNALRKAMMKITKLI